MARNQDREMCTYKTEKQIYQYIYILCLYMVLIEMSTTLTEMRAFMMLYVFLFGGGRELCR